MKLIFLGTGTSTGIPQIGCKCETCSSTNSKDKRLRASLFIETDDKTNILIDCGPDLRQQFIRHEINQLFAILLTHEHYDHVGGLDDVRPLGEVNVFAEKKVLFSIKRNMPYCFAENKYPGVPALMLHEIELEPIKIKSTGIQPIRVMHANLAILGFRFDNFAYLTDVKTLENDSIEKLKNLDLLIINALRHTEHTSHLNLKQAIDMALKINAGKTYFTHLSHDMGKHEQTQKLLPDNILIAYDGLELFL